MESGNAHESHDELIELVAGSETGILHLFSQNQLQVIFYFSVVCVHIFMPGEVLMGMI